MQEKKDILFKPDSGVIDKEYVDYVLNYIIDVAEKAIDTFRDKLAKPPEEDIYVNPEWLEEAIGVNSKVINTSKSIKKKIRTRRTTNLWRNV